MSISRSSPTNDKLQQTFLSNFIDIIRSGTEHIPGLLSRRLQEVVPFMQSLGLTADVIKGAVANTMKAESIMFGKDKAGNDIGYSKANNIGRVNNPQLQHVMLDSFINQPPHETAVIIQQALYNVLGVNTKPDGVIGSQTIGALNSLNAEQQKSLYMAIQQARIERYRDLAIKDPTKHGTSLNGWMNRIYTETELNYPGTKDIDPDAAPLNYHGIIPTII